VDRREPGELKGGLLGRREQVRCQARSRTGRLRLAGPAAADLRQEPARAVPVRHLHAVEQGPGSLAQQVEPDGRSRADSGEPLLRPLGHPPDENVLDLAGRRGRHSYLFAASAASSGSGASVAEGAAGGSPRVLPLRRTSSTRASALPPRCSWTAARRAALLIPSRATSTAQVCSGGWTSSRGSAPSTTVSAVASFST